MLICWCCTFKLLFFHFIHLFSSIPVVQSSLIQNPIFLHSTTALPLPACLSLLLPTLQKVWYFPHATFSCWFFSHIIRGGGNTCLTASSLEERLKNRCGLWSAMKLFWCSKPATICSGNTTEIHPPPLSGLLLLSQPVNLHLLAACPFPHVWGVNYVTCKIIYMQNVDFVIYLTVIIWHVPVR